jgi:hypothetical protein
MLLDLYPDRAGLHININHFVTFGSIVMPPTCFFAMNWRQSVIQAGLLYCCWLSFWTKAQNRYKQVEHLATAASVKQTAALVLAIATALAVGSKLARSAC